MIVRRIGQYAFVRPGREMLFTILPAEEKYKAKNFIDTVCYRGGDMVSAWISRILNQLGNGNSVTMIAGIGIAGAWAATGYALGKAQRNRTTVDLDLLPEAAVPQ